MNKSLVNQTDLSEDNLRMKISDPKGQAALEKVFQLQRDIVFSLDLLYARRLIENIARPISKLKKIELIADFSITLAEVHKMMKAMETSIDLSHFHNLQTQSKHHQTFYGGENKENREVKRFSYEASQQLKIQKKKKKMEVVINVKLSYFNIRRKYIQILVQSSLSNFKKIVGILQLTATLQLIDVDQWLSNCIKKMEKNQKNLNQKSTICC